MPKTPRHFILAAMLAALLPACAYRQEAAPLPPLVLEASPAALRADAAAALAAAGRIITDEQETADENAPADEKTSGGWTLRLSEQTTESILSRAESGAVSAYNVRYRLRFRLQNPAGEVVADRALAAARGVAHDESRYLAGRRERAEVAAQLRRRALAQMIFQIRQLAGWRQ